RSTNSPSISSLTVGGLAAATSTAADGFALMVWLLVCLCIWPFGRNGPGLYVARDHHALNFARAFVDLRDARVAVVPLDRSVFEVAVAAVNLDRVRADFLGQFGRVELRLRRLGQAPLAGAA